MELRAIMAQIPNINMEALDQYDRRLVDPNAQKVGEKRRKDQFKKLIAGTVEVMPLFTTRRWYFSVISHWERWVTYKLNYFCLLSGLMCFTSPLTLCIQKALCQQFRKEVHIRNLPSLFKKPKIDKDIISSEALSLADLFDPQSHAV